MNNHNDKPVIGIFKTVHPDKPTQDFNEWINYIYKEAEKKKLIVISDDTETFFNNRLKPIT